MKPNIIPLNTTSSPQERGFLSCKEKLKFNWCGGLMLLGFRSYTQPTIELRW
ncbi:MULTISPECIES: hypothetical protein [Moorena]|uniref:hypothetical protein n=1 Tax=Moorena TaxID=1155738 RepID=UPI0003105DA3|nr:MULTISPECIES: hypothetical protein [Moorena]NEP30891.1 hypothetical protein [Moorena sp. SIO3B2]NEP67048.1 hypothetical protein [Moorena sp. SIO3A5]NEQ10824.1 hypothetical protein [Moorena sp. SIO4E2]NER88860.1 hypothetical protein [Moorena sp. SIO3A2]NES46670.1 hypothetical protein [Moorena sp. SIO2C4]